MLLHVPRAVRGGAALIAALAIGGCSIGSDDEPRPSGRQAAEIDQVFQALERATREGDFRTICNELFSSTARRRAGGRGCVRLLRSNAREVRRPRIELVDIRLKKGGADVRVRTRAAGQRPLEDEIELVRERGEYRIQALAG